MELGLRQALGASGRTRVRSVITEALAVAVVAIAAGALLAGAGGALIRTKLYGVTAGDPLSYALVATAMLLFTCGAVALPALRAVRIVPADALRQD